MNLIVFKAIIKEIMPIKKNNGQIINYVFVMRPELCNDLGAQVEPEIVLPIMVYPGKARLLNGINEGDHVEIAAWLNSKKYITRMGWENYHLSLHLKTLNKTTL